MFKNTFPELSSVSSQKYKTCFILLGLKLAVATVQLHILATKVNMLGSASCIVLCTCLAILLSPFQSLVRSIYLKARLEEYFLHWTVSDTQGCSRDQLGKIRKKRKGHSSCRNLHRTPCLFVWGFFQEGPVSQVWSSLCTERAAGIVL